MYSVFRFICGVLFYIAYFCASLISILIGIPMLVLFTAKDSKTFGEFKQGLKETFSDVSEALPDVFNVDI